MGLVRRVPGHNQQSVPCAFLFFLEKTLCDRLQDTVPKYLSAQTLRHIDDGPPSW